MPGPAAETKSALRRSRPTTRIEPTRTPRLGRAYTETSSGREPVTTVPVVLSVERSIRRPVSAMVVGSISTRSVPAFSGAALGSRFGSWRVAQALVSSTKIKSWGFEE